MFAILQRILEHPISRVVFSVVIIASLVPHEWMLANDAWFLAIFGPEVLARGLLIFRRESLPVLPGRRRETGWRLPRVGEVILLSLDLLAIISFIPAIAEQFVSARWLRLFRLTRTVLLLRYWAPVVTDLWEVTRRPERKRQLVFIFGTSLVICFAGAVLLDHVTTEIGDDFDGDGVVGDPHDHDFFVRMWWAFRQIEDPGNLLASPHDAGTLVVSVVLSLLGLFVISFIIGIGTDVVTDLADIGRMRSPGMSRHTVVVNATSSAKRLLRELLHEEFKLLPAATEVVGLRWLAVLWRNLRTSRSFVVVGRSPERPDFLHEPEFARVVYRAWEDNDDDVLMHRGDVLAARRVVLLANDADPQPDDDTIRTTLSVVEQMRECQDDAPRRMIAEIVSLDSLPAADRACNRARFPLSTQVIATEALIARCVAAVCRRRGLADLLTTLLRSEGHEIYAWTPDYGASLDFSSTGGPDPLEALARAGAKGGAQRVIPIGIIPADESASASTTMSSLAVRAPGAILNPRGPLDGKVRGLIAIAENALRLDDFVAAHAGATPQPANAAFDVELETEAPLPLRKVLLCGFRPATVQLLESLLAHAEPDARVMLLVADEHARLQALDKLAAHGVMVRHGLVDGALGSFEVDAEASAVQWRSADGVRAARLDLCVGDWTSPRTLGELPREMGSAIDFDLVLFASNGSGESDARNTAGLMTIEALGGARDTVVDGPGQPRVICEVDDVELAGRLNARFRAMGWNQVHVFSTDELRALIVFQSVIVPHFSTILIDLVSGQGHGAQHRLVAAMAQAYGERSRQPYAAVAQSLRAQGRILIAVDHADGRGPLIGEVDDVDLARARLWVLERVES